MEKKINNLNLQINITEINVWDDFYEIHYEYTIDGKNWNEDMYDSDFDNGLTGRQWKKKLENGVAMSTVLSYIAENSDEFIY